MTRVVATCESTEEKEWQSTKVSVDLGGKELTISTGKG